MMSDDFMNLFKKPIPEPLQGCEYWDYENKTCRRSEVPASGDAVSRQLIIDELNRLGRHAFKDDTDYDSLFDFVDKLPSEEPIRVTEWIPVTERLPEAVEEVIVTRQYCNLLDDEDPIDTTVAEYMGELNGKPYFKQHGSELVGKVIAWMPLPKPWKGDEE